MLMQHPVTGAREDIGAFSVPALFLGPVWFFIRGLTRPGVFAILGVAITLGWGWLALPFVFPIVYRRHLEQLGWQPVVPGAPPVQIPGAPLIDPNEALARMQADVARIPVDTTICMQCGTRTGISSQPIGFSRVLDKSTSFEGGKIKFTTRANVVKAQLVLCELHWKPRKNMLGMWKLSPGDYALHPWWGAAQQHGFTTHLDPWEVQRYK